MGKKQQGEFEFASKDNEQTGIAQSPESEVSGEVSDQEADEAAYAAALTAVSDDEALAEFGDYDALEDGEEAVVASERAGATAEASEDAALQTPKERRLAEMRLEARIEAVIFASKQPLKAADIWELLGDSTVSEEHVQEALNHLVEFYEDRCGGFKLHYLKRLGYQFQTSDAAGAIMERMFASRPRPISRAALETLAIIAFRQPVTRAEVEFIRGVDAGSIFKTLLERDLIKCVGRKEIVGRPMLFGTTEEFLKVFNLSSIKDLPPLESFQPSREVMQGAMDKINEGDELVDVEEYIADNTADEYASDGLEEAAAEGDGVEFASESTKDGTAQDSEVAIPDGDRVAEGSGDLDL